jgi:hypothetical protein
MMVQLGPPLVVEPFHVETAARTRVEYINLAHIIRVVVHPEGGAILYLSDGKFITVTDRLTYENGWLYRY